MGRDDLATLVLFSAGSREDVMRLRLIVGPCVEQVYLYCD